MNAGLLATNYRDCLMRAAEFKAKAASAESPERRELYLYFASQWDLLAEDSARIIDRTRPSTRNLGSA